MEQVVKIKDIVNDSTINVVLHEPTSYIKPFFSEPKHLNIILVYKLIPTTTKLSTQNCDITGVSELDITGSPLECPFSPVRYDDTLVSYVQPKHWQTEEENHGPVPVERARHLLSLCNLYVRSWMMPVWVVCDGRDPLQTVLMSSLHDNKSGWVTRTAVELQGQCSYEEALILAGKIKEEHLTKSRILEHKLKILMSQTFDDCGNLTNDKTNGECSISLRLSWTCTSIASSPHNYAKTTMMMSVVVERPTSVAYYLWKQLKFLNELAALLTTLKGKRSYDTIEYPKLDKENDHVTGKADILRLLYESDYATYSYLVTANQEEELSGKVQRVNLATSQAVSGKSTLYLDSTHALFLLLAQCGDSENLVTCINCLFEEVQADRAKLFVHPNNTTTIAQMLLDLMRKNMTPAEPTGLKAMELLLEMGLGKLSKDYEHIFQSSGLATLEQLGFPGCSSDFSEKFNVLGRLHVTLEILLLLETEMNFSINTLYPLTEYTLNNISTQVKSFSQLLESASVKFEAPVITREVQNIITRRYSSWTVQFTSERERFERITTVHFSTVPIFPYVSAAANSDSQLCELEDEDEDDSHELYCSKLVSLSDKLK